MSRARASVQLERKLVHATTASVIPILSFFIPNWLIVALALCTALLLLAMDIGRLTNPGFNRFIQKYFGVLFKAKEQREFTGATLLAIAMVATFLLFPKPIPAIAFLYLALGDPAASVLGVRFGRIRIGSKSLEGTLAFLGVSVLVAIVLWQLGAYAVLWPALVGALVAAVVELLPLRVDDNFTVPLLAGLTMRLLWMG